MDHIQRQLRVGALNFDGCERLVDGIVTVLMSLHARMKADERAEETAAKWRACQVEMKRSIVGEQADRARAACGALEMVLDRIHKIRIDTANAKLRAIAPVIRQHGVEYERSHFARKMASGAITMERTTKWISHTIKGLLESPSPCVVVPLPPLTSSQAATLGETYSQLINLAAVELVVDYPNWGGEARSGAAEDMIPETMMLDLLRVKALNAHFHHDVVCAIILVQVDGAIGAGVCGRDKIVEGVAAALKELPPRSSNYKRIVEVAMDNVSQHLSKADESLLRALIVKHMERSHPVYRHMVRAPPPPHRLLFPRDEDRACVCLSPAFARGEKYADRDDRARRRRPSSSRTCGSGRSPSTPAR